MKCIFCGHSDSRVLDSRASEESNSIRRRRECSSCSRRFTTYEIIETTPIMVVKNGGVRQPFDPAKIKNVIIKACGKRPVAMHDINNLIKDIEREILNSLEQEVTSAKIGELVMKGLKELDEVAYVRFASVYRQFKDVTTFINFISDFEKKIKEE